MDKKADIYNITKNNRGLAYGRSKKCIYNRKWDKQKRR